MKLLVSLVASLSMLACSMDRPPQAPKPAPVKGLSEYVKAGHGLFSVKKFRELLYAGAVVTYEDLDALADMTGANKDANTSFWMTHGIEFLLRANLPILEPQTLRTLAAKQVNKNILASKQDYSMAIRRFPADIKTVLESGNPKLVAARLKDLLGSSKTKDVSTDQEIERLKNKIILDLWEAVLTYESIAYALNIISQIKCSEISPAKTAVFNSMIDSLVQKICKNIFVITRHLRKQDSLRPLFNQIRQVSTVNIENWGMMMDATDMKNYQRTLLGLLNSSSATCPTYVKERLLELTQ